MNRDRNPLVRDGEQGWPEGDSISRHWLRRGFNELVCQLARVQTRGTILGLGAVARSANLTHLIPPTAREVSLLYDWLRPAESRRIARDIAALWVRNLAAIALAQREQVARLAALVRWHSDASAETFTAGSGQVLIAAHIGAFFGIRAAFHRTGRDVLMLRDLPLLDATARARALKQAVEWLRDGGLVVATLDGPGGTSTTDVECLGRRIVLRRGPFVLARLTRAPLVPVVCTWTRGGEIEVRTDPSLVSPHDQAIDAPAFETALATRTARWLESYLRSEPRQIWPSTLRHYLAAPRAAVGD